MVRLACTTTDRWSAVAAIFLFLIGVGVSRAQTPQPARMARLTYVTGQVQLSGAGGQNSQPAVPNVPVLEGAVLATAFDGQTELEFEDGSVVRMTPNTELSVVRLGVDGKGNLQTGLELLHGLIYMELRSSPHFQYSVDAQGDTVSPLENSTVRVDLDQPPAAIAVLDGKVRVTSVGPDGKQGQQAEASAGQTLRRGGLGEQTASVQNLVPYLVKDGIDPDSWDQWNVDRDRAAADEAANRTSARDGVAGDQGYGWSDLDANGGWYNLPGQGLVWQPDIAAYAGDGGDDGGAYGGNGGFDPYGYGNWSWTPGFGYVWASGYAWGWTPYRCGNWGYWGGFGWGWAPGPSCGRYGFGGRGFRVNLHNVPKLYHGPHPPPTGPVPSHPLVAVHGGRAPEQRIEHVHTLQAGARTINGVAVQPLQPVGGTAFAGSGDGFGGALQRDFPVNRTTHDPVIGVPVKHTPPTQAFADSGRATWRPAQIPGSGGVQRSQQTAQPPRATYVSPTPMPTQMQGAPGGRPQMPAPIYSRPMPQYAAPQMPPRMAPAPTYNPPPVSPRYNPPPAPHYSAPRQLAPHYGAPPPAARLLQLLPRMSAPRIQPAPAAAPRGR